MHNKCNLCLLGFFLLATLACAQADKDIHPVPENMTVQQKKQRFLKLIAPQVMQVSHELDTQYQNIVKKIASGETITNFDELKNKYKVQTQQELLTALKPHPPSITLAQAAMESAWASSRFFVKANNIFGVWSFNATEPRIAAAQKRGNKTIWLKKYASIKESIADYYKVLATAKAFVEFRKLKMISNDPYQLATKLNKYSEKGAAYGKELISIIKYNKLTRYDKQLVP